MTQVLQVQYLVLADKLDRLPFLIEYANLVVANILTLVEHLHSGLSHTLYVRRTPLRISRRHLMGIGAFMTHHDAQ